MEKVKKNKLKESFSKVSKTFLKYFISAIICIIIFLCWGAITYDMWHLWQYKALLNIVDHLFWIILPPIVFSFVFSLKKTTIHTFIFSLSFVTVLSLYNILFINSFMFNFLLEFVFTCIVFSIQLLIITFLKFYLVTQQSSNIRKHYFKS